MAPRRSQPQRLEIPVLLRIIPAMRLLEARELNEHRKDGLPFALDDVRSTADGEIAPAIMFDRGEDTLPVLLHFLGIGDFQDIEQAVSRHSDSPFINPLLE